MSAHDVVLRRLVVPELRLVTFTSGPDDALRDRGWRPMLVTPWGVLADAPYPWDEILAIEHRILEPSGGGWSGDDARHDAFSILEVTIADGQRIARREVHTMLEALEALLAPYAAEARRPVAIGLDGGAPARDGRATNAFDEILSGAREFMASDQGRSLLTTRFDGYRSRVDGLASDAIPWLRRKLLEAPEASDPGALAAVMAAELGAEAVVDDLCALALCPNAMVAALSKAAALRLGAHPSRPGPLEELRGFLAEPELEKIWNWAHAR